MHGEYILRSVEGSGKGALRLRRSAAGEVSVDGDADPQGRPLRILRREPGGLLVALWGERIVCGVVNTAGESMSLFIDGRMERVRLRTAAWDRMEQAEETGRDESGPLAIASPIPGLIKSLPVKPGDAVKAGQTVAVLEAMKMENEIASPRAGKVLAVEVEPGQSVGAGVVLVRLAPLE